jgi:hypothetical protein
MAAVRIPKGSTSPSLADIITVDGVPQDLTGASAKFKMRPVTSSILKVDATATIPSQAGTGKGHILYNWVAANTDTQGEYSAWWYLTMPGSKILQSPPFEIFIDEPLAQGDATNTGAIAANVREHIPIAYDALAKDARYGEPRLQSRVDTVKFRLFGTVIPAALEATVYNPLVLDFAGKVAALQIIPAAVDFWMVQHVSVSATGTNENTSYPDRIDALWRIHERLLLEVKQDADLVEEWVIVRRKNKGPLVSTEGLPFLTENPQDFFRQGRDPRITSNGPFWDL